MTACNGSTTVRLHAFLDAGLPVSGLEISALPFDAEGVLDSLARSAASPRPDFPEMEADLENYRRSDGRTANANTGTAWRATRDSVARLAAALSRMDRNAPGYRESYARFRELYARYAARQAAHEAELRKAFGSERQLADRAARAADSVRAWEREAYRAFPQLAESLVARTGRIVERVTTDSAGQAELYLKTGTWWLVARIPTPDNPFQELEWNVPVTVRAGLPIRLPLMRANAAEQWRH